MFDTFKNRSNSISWKLSIKILFSTKKRRRKNIILERIFFIFIDFISLSTKFLIYLYTYIHILKKDILSSLKIIEEENKEKKKG